LAFSIGRFPRDRLAQPNLGIELHGCAWGEEVIWSASFFDS